MLPYLKAIAAVIATILGSGIITGHWVTDAELILAAVNGAVVFATPNYGRRAVPPSSNAPVTR